MAAILSPSPTEYLGGERSWFLFEQKHAEPISIIDRIGNGRAHMRHVSHPYRTTPAKQKI